MSSSHSGDGRNIDTQVGELSGEAARQVVPGPRDTSAGSPDFTTWGITPASTATSDRPSYYERPVIKEPVWIWAVPVYFFVGGAAGAAAVLGAVAQRDQSLRGLARKCRLVAASGTITGTGLLIYDLGRPKRFLNMLRVFRPTSAMNVGSWLLAGSGAAMSTSAMLAHRRGRLGRLGDAAGTIAGIIGGPLSGYTGVLLADTSVPIWQASRRILPGLFVASSVSTAASFLELMELDDAEEAVANRFGVIGQVAELIAGKALEKEVERVESVGRPLKEGLSGSLWKAATGLTIVGLVLGLLPGASARRRRIDALLGVASGLAVRFAVFHAGKASARDPHATFDQHRAGRGGVDVTGRPAVTSAGDGSSA